MPTVPVSGTSRTIPPRTGPTPGSRCCADGTAARVPVYEASVVGRPLDESDLIQRAKRGDKHAYEELVHAYQGIAFRTAYVIAGNGADAEEAAQDGFVKAWRALGRFRAGAPFRPWLLQIVANEARNRRRSAGRRAHPALRAAAEQPSGGAAPAPGASVLPAETRDPLLA